MNYKPASFHLQWHVTERCNLRCTHCYQDPKLLKEEIKNEDLFNILDGFASQIKEWGIPKGSTRVSLTGGEPLAKEGIFDLIKMCQRYKDVFHYGILTNGILLNKNMVSNLKGLGVDYLQISLEGMEEVNDSIRGKGVFKKAVEAAKMVKESGISTNFSMTVTKVNLNEVPKVIKLSKEIGIGLGIRRCVPCGSGKKMEKDLLLPRDVRLLWHYLLKAKRSFWNPISIGCEDGMMVQDIPSHISGDCSAGYASFTVLPNADVYPCRRLPIFSGNLLKNSFKEIYEESEPLKELRNLNNINDVCHSCSYGDNCHGGAKCMAFSYFGDASAPDPQCWRLFKPLPDKSIKWKNSSKKRPEKLNTKWIRTK